MALPEDNLPDRPAAIPKVDPEKLEQSVLKHVDHWIGLKENSNRKKNHISWENHGKIVGFRLRFSQENQSNEFHAFAARLGNMMATKSAGCPSH